ncbi:hypothetical protein, partial [Mycobacterium tuberculosis]
NTGNANTGVANSGTVNTGAFITGNDSNGILWRGNFEGLFSAYLGFTIEQFPLAYHAVGGIGPLHVAPVPISAAHFNITNASIGLGPFTIPEIQDPHRRPGIRGLRTNHHLGCHRS